MKHLIDDFHSIFLILKKCVRQYRKIIFKEDKEELGISDVFMEMEEKQNLEVSSSFQFICDSIGYVLPLDCGHNGPFASSEVQAYEYHLSQCGFIVFWASYLAIL